MLKVNRIYSWIFIGTFALLLPSVQLFKFVDELIVLLLISIALIDCLINRNWTKYRGLWVISGILFAYAIYSLLFQHYNTPIAILVDMIIELKPFVPFFIFMSCGLFFTQSQKYLLKIIATFNCICVAVIFIFFRESLDDLILYISYVGIIAFVSALVYIFSSIQEDGSIDKASLAEGLILMGLGSFCTRAKFFAIFLLAIYFLVLYKPGLSRKSLLQFSALAICIIIAVAAVSWYKFSYYFITGNSGRLDPEVMEAFARPIMYATGGLILLSHFPFGSGFASFASYASGDIHYSSLYYDYGINNIVGLSPNDTTCICDAFYPCLAQFGFVGVALFVYFWVYIAGILRNLIRKNPQANRYYFAIGWIVILFIFIENIASTVFVQSGGQCTMMILGGICSYATLSTNKSTMHLNNANKISFSFVNHRNTCQNKTQ